MTRLNDYNSLPPPHSLHSPMFPLYLPAMVMMMMMIDVSAAACVL